MVLFFNPKVALASVVQLLGQIPGQGTCLGCGFGPPGGIQEAINWCFSLTLMFLTLFFLLPFPFSKKNQK